MGDRKKISADDRAEDNLAQRFNKLERSSPLPENKKQELRVLGGAPQPAARTKGRELIDAVKTLGYFPKETKSAGPEEKALAKNILRCQFTPAERIEINELRRTSVHPSDRARSAQIVKEAQESPNPMEGFADEAENRLDQDLLQLASGNRTRDLQRRLKKYQNFIAAADTQRTRNPHRRRGDICARC